MLLDSGWLHRFTGLSPPAGSLSAALLPSGGTGREYHYPWRCHCDTPAATAGFMDGWTRLHLIDWPSFNKSWQGGWIEQNRKSDFVSSPCFYRWSSRILQRRCPSQGTSGKYPEHRIWNYQRAVEGRNYPPTT